MSDLRTYDVYLIKLGCFIYHMKPIEYSKVVALFVSLGRTKSWKNSVYTKYNHKAIQLQAVKFFCGSTTYGVLLIYQVWKNSEGGRNFLGTFDLELPIWVWVAYRVKVKSIVECLRQIWFKASQFFGQLSGMAVDWVGFLHCGRLGQTKYVESILWVISIKKKHGTNWVSWFCAAYTHSCYGTFRLVTRNDSGYVLVKSQWKGDESRTEFVLISVCLLSIATLADTCTSIVRWLISIHMRKKKWRNFTHIWIHSTGHIYIILTYTHAVIEY